jgi:hypothetical protein
MSRRAAVSRRRARMACSGVGGVKPVFSAARAAAWAAASAAVAVSALATRWRALRASAFSARIWRSLFCE